MGLVLKLQTNMPIAENAYSEINEKAFYEDTGLKNQDKKIIMLFPIFAFFKLQFVHNFV